MYKNSNPVFSTIIFFFPFFIIYQRTRAFNTKIFIICS
nr:MAG TPA: hypothetical protein [Caudoviricetes sp.]